MPSKRKNDDAFAMPQARRRSRLSLQTPRASKPAAARHSLPLSSASMPPTGRPDWSSHSHRPAQNAWVDAPRDGIDRDNVRADETFYASPSTSTLRIKAADVVRKRWRRDDTPEAELARVLALTAVKHGNELSRFTNDDDDMDEISLLGLAAVEVGRDSRHRERDSTPSENFLDDISLKMESPANISIGKFFEEEEEAAVNAEAQAEDGQRRRRGEAVHDADLANGDNTDQEELVQGPMLDDALTASREMTLAENEITEAHPSEPPETLQRPEEVIVETSEVAIDHAPVADETSKTHSSEPPETLQVPKESIADTSAVDLEDDRAEALARTEDADMSDLMAEEALDMDRASFNIAVQTVPEIPNFQEEDTIMTDIHGPSQGTKPINGTGAEVQLSGIISEDAAPAMAREPPDVVETSFTVHTTMESPSIAAINDEIPEPSNIGDPRSVIENDFDNEKSDVEKSNVVETLLIIESEATNLAPEIMQESETMVLEDEMTPSEAESAEKSGTHIEKAIDDNEQAETTEDSFIAATNMSPAISEPGSTSGVIDHQPAVHHINTTTEDESFLVGNLDPRQAQTTPSQAKARINHTESVASTTPATPDAGSVPTTPRRGLASLPFAGEEFINTPARPVEDTYLMEYHTELTPSKNSTSNPVQRTPPHREDAFLDVLNSARDTVKMNSGLNLIAESDSSFVSTLVDVMEEEPTDTNAESAEVAEVSPRPVLSTNTVERSVFATPQSHVNLQKLKQNRPTTNGVLGSAIRLTPSREMSPVVSSVDLKQVLNEADAQSVEKDTNTASLSGPHFKTLSEPRRIALRPCTPPPRKRYSMDIPMSKYNPSIEVWDNPTISPCSPKPQPPVQTSFISRRLRTPSPRVRTYMDVPLSREAEAVEIWPAENGSRGRRNLQSPKMAHRLSSRSQLIVEESPQVPHAGVVHKSSPWKAVPKLDFGIVVEHSHTLSDSEDAVVQRHSPVVSDEASALQDNQELLASSDSLNDHTDLEEPVHDLRKSAVKHFTPRSTRLRQLAQHLAAETEKIAESAADEGFAPGEAVPDFELEVEEDVETATSRAALRKQLSDDIDLDFAPETSTPLPDRRKSEALDVLRKESSRIATPIFKTRRRRRQSSPPPSPPVAPEPEPEPLVADRKHQKGGRKSKSVAASTQTRKVTSTRLEKLATFGAVPEVLPRSRRDRKKPSEYWKVRTFDATSNDPLVPGDEKPVPARARLEKPNSKRFRSLESDEEEDDESPMVTTKKQKNQKETNRVASTKPILSKPVLGETAVISTSPVSDPTIAKPTMSNSTNTTRDILARPPANLKSGRHKMRPGEFDGPLSTQRKIKASASARPSPVPAAVRPRTRPPVRPSEAAKTSIRIHNFSDDEDII